MPGQAHRPPAGSSAGLPVGGGPSCIYTSTSLQASQREPGEGSLKGPGAGLAEARGRRRKKLRGLAQGDPPKSASTRARRAGHPSPRDRAPHHEQVRGLQFSSAWRWESVVGTSEALQPRQPR